jgi:uncharacterized protein (DUF488 family)
MFYKENLINYAEKRIPPQYTKICAADTDICFDKPNWYSIISQALNYKTALQPYKMANWLDIDYTAFIQKHNSVDAGSSKITWELQHPGFLYAFDRAFLRTLSLEDRTAITTGGDTVLNDILCKREGAALSASFNFFKKSFTLERNLTDLQLGSCDINIYHLNHGSREGRKYHDIQLLHTTLLRLLGNISLKDIFNRREDGILEWVPKYHEIYNKIMLQYFHLRLEDLGDVEKDAPSLI